MKITDIQFNRSCCGAHGLRAEHIRDDGVGFLIKADLPDEVTPLENLTYAVKVYEADRNTLRAERADLSASELLDLIAG